MKNKIKNTIFKIKGKALEKQSEVKQMAEINKVIDEAQIKKTNLLLEMGILAYEKIRDDGTNDVSLEKLCSEIVETDKIIYGNYLDLVEIEEIDYKAVCKCGHIIDSQSKFCAECGRKIELEEVVEEYIVCEKCDCELEVDSKYCVCCGSKIFE